MPFEEIKGLKNREFKDDDHCNLVLAIKANTDDTLYDRFQKFWMKRCANGRYLTDFDSWWILSRYAREMFDRADQYQVEECIRRTFQNGKSISPRDMTEIYLTAIDLMTMRYDIKEDK